MSSEDNKPGGTERRLLLFVLLSFIVLWAHFMLTASKRPPEKPGQAARPGALPPVRRGPDERPLRPAGEQPPKPQPPEEEAAEELPQAAPRWVTLGSADPDAPYRMLVTLTNRGAAVARIELNSRKYNDLEDRSGYLGNLVIDESLIDESMRGKGCPVQIVGPATPADRAGIRPGDLIVAVDEQPVTGPTDFSEVMKGTKPDRDVALTVLRDGKQETLTVHLERRPLELVRPEGTDPVSFLLTLSQYGDQKLADQRLRDASIQAIYKEYGFRPGLLRDLDLSNVDLPAGEIRLPEQHKADGIDQTVVAVTPEVRRATEAWLDVRGNAPGPLFTTLPSSSGRRIAPGQAEAVVDRVRDQSRWGRNPELFTELDGFDLRTGNWEVVAADPGAVVFRRVLPKRGLEIIKTFRLAEVPGDQQDDPNYRAYHLELEVKVRNTSEEERAVAFQLDGPTGLPDEGAWYASKVSRTWSMAGLRDVVVSFERNTPELVTCSKIASDEVPNLPWQDQSLTYIGVDAQYFSAIMIPMKENPSEIWFAESEPVRVGPVDEKLKTTTNVSCRVVSKTEKLAAGAEIGRGFVVFAGPKQPNLLVHYGLAELVYYGWWWYAWLAVGMSHILHAFFAVVHNYGLAIILLTVLVRGSMFPLSRKQALGAQKMQELQPEIKKIQEKYKKDMEGRSRAQQELFRKHNYNPLSGCLVIFIQLPIFIALYRSLMVDIELRQAPLISQAVRWCSNLAAPDMLYDWSWFMPEFIGRGIGFFGLGPYFNLLPVVTIVLFIMQQKMFMPPPTDEQQALQQKMMSYMMVFMGFLFFKVASGLCIYFIASSLWGLAERQLLPKMKHPEGPSTTESRADAKARERARAAAEAKAAPRETPTGSNGPVGGKKSRGRK